MNRNSLKLIRSIAMVMLAIGLILYPLKLSYTGAYFTHKATPKPDECTSSVKLIFDIHRFEGLNVRMNIEGNNVVANMNIPSGYGFNTRDIKLESTEFIYHGISSYHRPTEIIRSSNQLTLLYDWTLASDFDNNHANLYFKIAGKGLSGGASGLGERFIFTGNGQLVPEPLPVIKMETEILDNPGLLPQPESIVEPEEAEKSEVIVEPEKVAEPEVTVEPEKVAEPEVTVEPEKVAEPEVTVEPEKVAEPEVTVEPEKVAETISTDDNQ